MLLYNQQQHSGEARAYENDCSGLPQPRGAGGGNTAADEKRGQGRGRQVVQTLIHRAEALGFDHLGVEEIYHYNVRSKRMFESLGFQVVEQTDAGCRYRLDLIC